MRKGLRDYIFSERAVVERERAENGLDGHILYKIELSGKESLPMADLDLAAGCAVAGLQEWRARAVAAC
jgi:hypothetical protein